MKQLKMKQKTKKMDFWNFVRYIKCQFIRDPVSWQKMEVMELSELVREQLEKEQQQCVTEDEVRVFNAASSFDPKDQSPINIYRVQVYDSMYKYFCNEFIDFMLTNKMPTDFSNLICLNNLQKNDKVILEYFQKLETKHLPNNIMTHVKS